MKKLFLFVLALLGFAALHAQDKALLLSESFNGSAIPSGWSVAGMGLNNWEISATNNAGGQKNELMLKHNPTFIGLSRFVSPALNLTGKSNVVVSFKHCLDNYSGSHTLGIATTSDGGITWNSGWSASYSTDGQYEVREMVNTPDIGKENVQFCIYFEGNALNIDYWYFDDITIFCLEANDAELATIDVPELVMVGNNFVDFTVVSKGVSPITSIEASYQFAGHDMVTETFETNLASLESASFTFATPTFLEADNYDLTVNILKVNGVVDDDAENNTLTKEISVNLGLAQRIPMIEHFSSSTCGPCVNVNNAMMQFCAANEGKFTYTKYPMNFPGSGDPYYTSEVGNRANFYNVPFVPYVIFDGVALENNPVTQEIFDVEYGKGALAEIRGAFSIEGNTITLTADLMAYAKLENVRAFVSVNEKTTTNNVGTNGETEFHHILMKMLPHASGSTLTINAGDYETLTFEADLSSTHVEEYDDLEVAVWLQDYSTKYIYNSHYLYENESHPYPVENLQLTASGDNATATWNAPSQGMPSGYNVYVNGDLVVENNPALTYTFNAVGDDYYVVEVCAVYDGEMTSVKAVRGVQVGQSLGEHAGNSVSLYPNPCSGSVHLMAENDLQEVKVIDITGRLLRQISVAGKEIVLNVSFLNTGIYFINTVQQDGTCHTQKLIIR